MPLRPAHLLFLVGCLTLGALPACIPVPEGYQYWTQVNREYKSRDYGDTLNYLNDVLRTENDYTARAAALKVVILGGITRSALAIEEACAKGISRVGAWDSRPYTTCVDQFRSRARTRALDLIDALSEFEKATAAGGDVSLDFPLPEGSARSSSMLGRTEAGSIPVEKVFDSAVALVVDHYIFVQVADLVATDDVAAVQKMFESPPVTVPKETFLVGVAKTLLAAAAVFGKDRLDDSAKQSATLKRARECLQPALEGNNAALQSQAKALGREISKLSASR
ncbi:MAG: hypothetical protein O2968_07430 [Acidobacteria bacterium]|nr:hypothetical protein [Acidobacteriota bacterium]